MLRLLRRTVIGGALTVLALTAVGAPALAADTTAADPSQFALPAPSVGERAAEGQKCSGTPSYGPIKYQVCVKWVRSGGGFYEVRGYAGFINTATTRRSFNWAMDYWQGGWKADDGGVLSVGAGNQHTQWATYTRTIHCDSPIGEELAIQYGTTPWSDWAVVSAYLPC
jgi:hypothetical protein